jgi:cytochrome P450
MTPPDGNPPVTDWTVDFDHIDPAWTRDPYSIWASLRDQCPVAHSDRYGGAWLPTRYDDIAAIAYDTEHFSSQGVIMVNARPGVPAPIGPAPPITSDPPFHQSVRRMLLPAFSPKAVDTWEAATRDLCRAALEPIADRDVVDAAIDYAQHIPVGVIARMLGLPPDDGELFRGFVHQVVEAVAVAPEERAARFAPIKTYIDAAVDDHVHNPRDDLIGFLLAAELDGDRLSRRHVRGMIELLLVAGIDTTWSAIGASIWHLAAVAADRHRLVAEPDLMPLAIEEFLRAYAPVTMARLVASETELHGCRMRPGDWVLLPFPAANRDAGHFPDADHVVLDRAVNPHAAFGLGIHRCIGSNLARMELRVALEEWLARFPDFTLLDPDAVTWSPGQARGPRTLPVRILRSPGR